MHEKRAVITPAFDVWSVAVTVFEMATGRFPWPKKYRKAHEDLIWYIMRMAKSGVVPEDILQDDRLDDSVLDLIQSSLQINADARPSVDELQNHSFFEQEYSPAPTDNAGEQNNPAEVVTKLNRLHDGGALTATTREPDDYQQGYDYCGDGYYQDDTSLLTMYKQCANGHKDCDCVGTCSCAGIPFPITATLGLIGSAGLDDHVQTDQTPNDKYDLQQPSSSHHTTSVTS